MHYGGREMLETRRGVHHLVGPIYFSIWMELHEIATNNEKETMQRAR